MPNMQTYIVVDYDSTEDAGGPLVGNAVAASHELVEWLDNPLGINPAPAWGFVGGVQTCLASWEDGDPATGRQLLVTTRAGVNGIHPIIMPNGVDYILQETTFWSWFYSANHDPYFQGLSAGGMYSSAGSFTGPAQVCPPGGSYSVPPMPH
jgi:hypothetical protein